MSDDSQNGDKIRCYFFGVSHVAGGGEYSSGSCGFAIPDLGIVYKNRHFGSLYECQYNGLLTLLRFIQNNKRSFKGIVFEILSDAAFVVYQLNHQKSLTKSLREYYSKALGYRSSIAFTLSWIPKKENQAISGLLDSPPFHPDMEIRFEDKRYSDIDRMGKGQVIL